MADMIKIIAILIFSYFVVKKYIIPRIAAKRAAKNGALIASHPIPEELQNAMAANGGRKVTGFDMRWIDLAASDEKVELDLREKANEMLMLASARGTDVRLNMVNMGVTLLLYVTYVV